MSAVQKLESGPVHDGPSRRSAVGAIDPGRLGTVLAVFAHPDDEAVLAGGLLAAAAEAGSRVVCLTATGGEHGTPDPETNPPAAMRRIRRAELERSLDSLGVDELRVIGLEDGRCDVVQPAVAARWVATIMADVAPDAVVSFGRDGVTGHPDHVAVGRWTDLAFASVAAPHAQLLHAVSAAAWSAPTISRLDQHDAFWPVHIQYRVGPE